MAHNWAEGKHRAPGTVTLVYGRDGHFFTAERLSAWNAELRAQGHDVEAMSMLALAPLLSARFSLGYEQGRIAGLALREWLAGS